MASILGIVEKKTKQQQQQHGAAFYFQPPTTTKCFHGDSRNFSAVFNSVREPYVNTIDRGEHILVH